MKKKNAKPQPTESQRFKINRAAAKALSRLRKETCLAQPGSICLEEWRECRDIIADEITKVAFVETDCKFYRDLLEQIAADPRRTRAHRLAASGLSFIDTTKAEAEKKCSKPNCRNAAKLQLLGDYPLCRRCGDEKNRKARARSALRRSEGLYSPSIMARWSPAKKAAMTAKFNLK